MSTDNSRAGDAGGGGFGSLFEQAGAAAEGGGPDELEETAGVADSAGVDDRAETSGDDEADEAGHDGDAAEGAAAAAQIAVEARVSGSQHPAGSSSPGPQAATAATTPSVRIQPDEDEPYEFKNCTVTINIQLLPDDGHEDGREVIVSVSSHIEGPLIEILRMRELEPFAQPILSMLKEHEERLPALGEARARQREQERTKASSAKSKTTVRTTSRPAASASAKTSSGPGKGGSTSGEQTTLFSLSTGRRPSDAPAGAQAGGN